MGKDDALYRPLPDSYELPPLPAEKPAPPRHSWISTILAILSLGFTFWGLISVVPRFGDVYLECHLSLSASTKILLSLSETVRAWPIPLALLALLYPWWVGRPAAGKAGRVLRTSSGWTLVIFWVWGTVALFLPLIVLLEGIKARR